MAAAKKTSAIDKATGCVALGGVSVGPATTLADLRRSPLGEVLRKQPAGEPPWETYSAGVTEIGGLRFMASLTFHAARLEQVRLSLHDEPSSASWDEWSEKGEKKKQAKHDAWLRKTLGAATRSDEIGVHYEYQWGQVLSSFDSRSASSDVVLSYSAASR